MKLIGKFIHFPLCPSHRRGRTGWHVGKILKVDWYKRKKELRSITVGLIDPCTGCWGKRIKLRPEEFGARYTSLMYRGKRVNVYGDEINA